MSVVHENGVFATACAPRDAISQQLLELDYAIRQAIEGDDGDMVRDLTGRYMDVLRMLISPERDNWAAIARQAADMLFRQREMAEGKQDEIRGELASVERQRKLMEGQRAPSAIPVSRSFLV